MIKNDQQYKATKGQIQKFEDALADQDAGRNRKPGVHPKLVQLQRDALKSEIKILQKQLDEYTQNIRKPG